MNIAATDWSKVRVRCPTRESAVPDILPKAFRTVMCMKIAICGSMAFAKEMLDTKKGLEALGHRVEVPCDTDLVANGTLDPENFEDNHKYCTKNDIIRKCFQNVERSDAVLVLNHGKNGIEGYVGASTFAEMMFAHHLKKKIFMLNKPPGADKLRYSHEMGIMQPVIIGGDLKKI